METVDNNPVIVTKDLSYLLYQFHFNISSLLYIDFNANSLSWMQDFYSEQMLMDDIGFVYVIFLRKLLFSVKGEQCI